MNFFRAATMPASLLKAPALLWAALIQHLRQEGAGVRESGAFLLGRKTDNLRVVTKFLPYEQLQTDALHDDYVEITAASFAKLWDLCRHESLSVVADVHTHRYGPEQSRSDCANPMVALAGHIALIVPRFAQGSVRRQDIGMYVYKGDHRWAVFSGSDVTRFFRLTETGDAK